MHIVKGEACCCNHGYSCLVIAAAVWQKSPFFLFDMCCHHGDHEKTDRMRAISGLCLYVSSLHPALSHPYYFFFVCLFVYFLATVTGALCSIHHASLCSTTYSNIVYPQPPTLSLVANYQSCNRLYCKVFRYNFYSFFLILGPYGWDQGC